MTQDTNTPHGQVPEALRFTKRPVTIEAIQWTGKNLREVITFTDGPPDTRSHHAGMAWEAYADLVARDGLMIYTLEDGPDRRAKHFADIGDWIIRGVKGEYYPCKPDIFEATYDRAAHVQNPAEIEHVAGDVSKNGAGLNMMDLIDAYAEARHRQGHSSYNAQTAAALQAVIALLDRIAELESELEAVGAGGVSGPLMGIAAPPTAHAEWWQSIETAPKEGVFLVFMQDEVRPARRMQVANWHPNVKIVGGLFAFDCAKVTHWMPLPHPPTSAEEVEHG